MVDTGATPDHAELAGLLEAAAPGRDHGEILDRLLETATARTTRDREAPLHPLIREYARTRKNEGVDIGRLLEEYSVLRSSLLRLWERDAPGPITFLRTLNETIDEAVSETVQEYRMGGDLLAMVCHDLRNPLQSLLLCGTQLERMESDDPRITRPAEVIMRATGRMNRLLDDLALFASMDLAAPQTTPAPIDPGAFLEEVAEAHRGAAEEKKLLLEWRVEAPVRPLTTDRNRVLRIIHHLIQHAIKVSPPNSKIALSVRCDDRGTRFSVEHGGRSPRSLDLAIARALASGFAGDIRLERDGSAIVFSIFE